jgi:protein phosphatase
MPLQKARAEADVNMISDVRSGDYFYLCSDGMLEISSDMEIANVISMQDKTDDEKVAILREVTRDNKDNHSAILIHVLEA